MISMVNEFLDDLRGGKMTEAPVVRIEHGELQGKVVTSPSGKAFFSFQGIPYAKPPLGSLRFKAPQPLEPWEGLRDATFEGNISAQIDPFEKKYVGDENCLFLNVYTPNLDGEFLPVMIFIHGGGFRFGSGSSVLYGGDYLVEKDVVVVTINYRCGALGFLGLNTPDVPGNAGLKDIIQAIRWVKNNIHSFGGNSGNLTVFGNSCGGVAVSLLTASSLTKNLINKAIIQSGTGLNTWGYQKNPVANAKNLAQTLGCESDSVDEILDFLSTTPVKEIVEANEKINPPEVFFEKGSNIFAVVIEKEFPGVEAVITEPFINFLTSGRLSDIPIMIGSTTSEFSITPYTVKNEDSQIIIPEDLQIHIPEDFHIERNTEESVAIADKIKRMYFAGGSPGIDVVDEYDELLSDKLVNIDTHRYVQYLIKVTNKPIYYYKFDYIGELNISKKLKINLALPRASHMDELGYLFKNDLQKDVEPSNQDIKMRERMLRLWTNFAKTGNPTPDENHYITVTWQPVTKDNLYYLHLSNELAIDTNPDKKKMDFWDDLYSKYFKIWEQPHVNNEEIPTEPEIVEEITTEPQIVETIPAETVVTNETVDIKTEELVEVDTAPPKEVEEEAHVNGNDVTTIIEHTNNVHIDSVKSSRTSNEIKMVQQSNGVPKDVIRANDPPEDDLPKNIGVNKFVNFFESLGGKK